MPELGENLCEGAGYGVDQLNNKGPRLGVATWVGESKGREGVPCPLAKTVVASRVVCAGQSIYIPGKSSNGICCRGSCRIETRVNLRRNEIRLQH